MRKLFSLPIDWFVLLIPILILLTGIVTIYTITFAAHHASLALNQLLYAFIGLVMLGIFMFSDYRAIGSVSSTLFIVGLLLLVPLLPMWAGHLPFVLKVFGVDLLAAHPRAHQRLDHFPIKHRGQVGLVVPGRATRDMGGRSCPQRLDERNWSGRRGHNPARIALAHPEQHVVPASLCISGLGKLIPPEE